MSTPFDPLLITDAKPLAHLCERLRKAGTFAFDTEFVGEDSYQPKVCLIQVATDAFHALIDPLANGLDTGPFWQLIVDPSVQVIVHAGSEDLAVCVNETGARPANVIDLQIAAGFTGLGHPISLSRLVSLTTHHKLHKSQTLTDWRTRPLGQEQLDYAVEDVIYLPAVYHQLHKRIESLGRWEWLLEECEALCDAAKRPATARQRFRRLRGTASLTPRQLAIVEVILTRRDELAARYNRPPRTILKDHLVVELARRGWTDVQKIRSLRGLTVSNADLRRIAEAVAEGKALPPEQWPAVDMDESSPDEEVLLAFVSAILRTYCDENQLAYSLLTTKADLKLLVRALDTPEADGLVSSLSRGWRARAVGGLLAGVLSGKSAVRLVNNAGTRRLIVE